MEAAAPVRSSKTVFGRLPVVAAVVGGIVAVAASAWWLRAQMKEARASRVALEALNEIAEEARVAASRARDEAAAAIKHEVAATEARRLAVIASIRGTTAEAIAEAAPQESPLTLPDGPPLAPLAPLPPWLEELETEHVEYQQVCAGELTALDLLPCSLACWLFSQVVARFLESMNSLNPSTRILHIRKIKCPSSEKAFHERHQDIGPLFSPSGPPKQPAHAVILAPCAEDVTLCFHGTSTRSADAIAAEGFRPPSVARGNDNV